MSPEAAPAAALPSSTGAPTGYAPWQAELNLGFRRQGQRTVLAERRHFGPLRVQKALYPEGDEVCQVLLLHPPSGVAGGDQLNIRVWVERGAHAQLTTPGAGKMYRSAGPEAAQHHHFALDQGACLEWLPQETIVFDGAKVSQSLTVDLAPAARFIGWDLVCLGRSAAGEKFTRGHHHLATCLTRNGRPLWLERGRLAGGASLLASPVGMAGQAVYGTLMAAAESLDQLDQSAREALLADLRRHVPADGADHGLTLLPGLLLARYLGNSTEAGRHWFAALWAELRPRLLGRDAVPPRIWNT